MMIESSPNIACGKPKNKPAARLKGVVEFESRNSRPKSIK